MRGGKNKGRLRISLIALCLGGLIGALIGAGPALTAAVATTLGTSNPSPAATGTVPVVTTNAVTAPASDPPPTNSNPTPPPVPAPTLTVKKLPPPPPPQTHTTQTNPNDPDNDGDNDAVAPPPPVTTAPVVTPTPTPTPPPTTFTPPPPTFTPVAHPTVVHHLNRVHRAHNVRLHHNVVRHHNVVHHSAPRHSTVRAAHIQRQATSLPHSVRVTYSAAKPLALRFGVTAAVAALLAGGFLVLLLAFPAELFNNTYQENEEEIHLLFARAGIRRYHLPPWVGLAAFVVVGVGLSLWIALASEGSRGNIIAVAVGLIVALPLVTFAFEVPHELYSRARSRIPGTLHVLPTALLVGFVCAMISRALHLEPAYLYGVFAGFVAARAGMLEEVDEAKAVLVGVIATGVIVVGAWFAWGAIDATAHGPHRDWVSILGSTALFWVFMLGAESLVFGLIPLRYLDGSILRNWRTRAWLIPQLMAAVFFVYVQMLHGDTRKFNVVSELIRPFSLFIIFGLLSFAFWGYFRWDRRPTNRRTLAGEPLAAPDLMPSGDQPTWTGSREGGDVMSTSQESDRPPGGH